MMNMLTPILTFGGCLAMALAGFLLITRSRKASFRTTIKSQQTSQGIGALVLLIGGGALLSTCSGQNRTPENATAHYATPVVPTARGITRAMHRVPPRTEPQQQEVEPQSLAPDTPFPANGLVERSLPLSGYIAQMQIKNLTDQNMIAIWYYNAGAGDQEAARMYVAAGQSANIDLPTFDYRRAGLFADQELGMVRGFGQRQTPRDFGFIDLKRPAASFASQPTLIVKTHGQKNFNPGYEKRSNR